MVGLLRRPVENIPDFELWALSVTGATWAQLHGAPGDICLCVPYNILTHFCISRFPLAMVGLLRRQVEKISDFELWALSVTSGTWAQPHGAPGDIRLCVPYNILTHFCFAISPLVVVGYSRRQVEKGLSICVTVYREQT